MPWRTRQDKAKEFLPFWSTILKSSFFPFSVSSLPAFDSVFPEGSCNSPWFFEFD
jgi:hypothetical protein